MGLADLERISDIRIDDRLRRIKRREMHRRSPKVPAEVAAISFELLAGETRQRLEAADDTARRGCYHKGRCGPSPQLYRTISILAAITTR
jgi:hypothetical protein